MSKEVILKGASGMTKQGITLHLNRGTTMKNGAYATKEVWLSWDQIGELLFENYCNVDDVEYRMKLRGEPNAT